MGEASVGQIHAVDHTSLALLSHHDVLYKIRALLRFTEPRVHQDLIVFIDEHWSCMTFV